MRTATAPPAAVVASGDSHEEPIGNRSGRALLALRWPVGLGLLQPLIVVALVLVELAQPAPAPEHGFGGIAYSNAITSPRSRAGVDLFRERLGWPADDAPGSGWRALSPAGYVWSKRAGIAALALVQSAALLACLRRSAANTGHRIWPWLIGPALTSAALLAMPPVSTDVFHYAAAGRLAGDGVNPYLVAPRETIAGDPFAPFNDWGHIATPYGPVWTTLSRLIVGLTGDDPFRVAIGFKAVAGFSAIALGLATVALARRLTGDPRLVAAALVLVTWQPALLLESAGAAHLDATMMLLALAGLLVMAAGGPSGMRGGLTVVAAGALVKPVVAPLVAFAALWRVAGLRQADAGVPTAIRRLLGDATAVAALGVVAFAPYWSGSDLWRTLTGESKRLYLDEALGVNAFWFWLLPRLPLVPEGDPWLELTDAVVRPGTALGTVVLLAGTWLWLLVRSWVSRSRPDQAPGLGDQVRAWAMATVALGLLPVNAHAWYAIWPVAPVALAWVATRSPAGPRDEAPRVPRWLWWYLAWSLVSFLVYHTHVWPGPEND